MKTDLICGTGLAPVWNDQYTIGLVDETGVGVYILHETRSLFTIVICKDIGTLCSLQQYTVLSMLCNFGIISKQNIKTHIFN